MLYKVCTPHFRMERRYLKYDGEDMPKGQKAISNREIIIEDIGCIFLDFYFESV